MIRAVVFVITMVGTIGAAYSADLAFPSTATVSENQPRSSSTTVTKKPPLKSQIDLGNVKVAKPRKQHEPALPKRISSAGHALNKSRASSSVGARENAGREEQEDRNSGQRFTVQNHANRKVLPDRQRQHLDLKRKRADLDRRQALLKREKGKFRQQKGRLASDSTATAITCDAARAVLADYGFKGVKPEGCNGKIFKFGATRDGTVFSIDVSLSGQLTKVQRLSVH
jgi:hypothetical protein